MQLTLHTDYALRLLIHLALSGERAASVQEVAQAYGVSVNHLAKVAQTLVRLGYVRSLRGRGGGLRLARAPHEINVGTLVRRTEQTLALVACFEAGSGCPIEPACRLKRILHEARQAFFAVLDGYLLADLLHQPKRLAGLLAMHPPPPPAERAAP